MSIQATLEAERTRLTTAIDRAQGQREEAWLSTPWPLFPGARRLTVVHLTLRRWRYLSGSGLLQSDSLTSHPERLLWFAAPQFRYLDDRAYRRWHRSIRRDLRQREQVVSSLTAYLDFYFGAPTDPDTPSKPTDPPPAEPSKFEPWKVLNSPLPEVIYIRAFGEMLGGRDAVLDCPLPQLWQLGDYISDSLEDSNAPRFRPGDRYRRQWDRALDRAFGVE